MPCCIFVVADYEVHVKTSKEPGADTEADVYIQLIGDRGDTGLRQCVMPYNEKGQLKPDDEAPFQEGQVETSLSKLAYCRKYLKNHYLLQFITRIGAYC